MQPAAYLLRGQVMHDRLRPSRNRFVYPVFCLRLNLDRLSDAGNAWLGIDRWRPVCLRTRDYGPRDGSDLAHWARQLLAAQQISADGEIWLQTFPRVLGFVFNPVSFWYCHDRSGALVAVLAEVNNTFGDTHRYLLLGQDGKAIGADTPLYARKLMHVSPFCAVTGHYEFRVRETAQTSLMAIDYHDEHGLLLKTAIGGHRQPLTARNLAQALLAQPLLTLGVIGRIHWQALKLWWKKVPFYRQPASPVPALSVQGAPLPAVIEQETQA
ncbi:DUF1365 domain-containing protein [Chitinibacter sp. ZOR0017]|uniref:DUF1365 domain-containing protein n=1 Tax=Chitinibacter sp. ZOR0017 TaxID=1339254 RepID=UPI0006909F35|nr:DUF1365 domain-containing protein [Chitinibacter sp. ZOR0017]